MMRSFRFQVVATANTLFLFLIVLRRFGMVAKESLEDNDAGQGRNE